MADLSLQNNFDYMVAFLKAIEEGDPQKADRLARRLQAQNQLFSRAFNRAINDRNLLMQRYGIQDGLIEKLFDRRWIRRVNLADVLDGDAERFNASLRSTIEEIGFIPDPSPTGRIKGSERLIINYGSFSPDIPIIGQMEKILHHIVTKYSAFLLQEGYPAKFVRNSSKFTSFAAATKDGGYHYTHIHSNAVFVVTYYVHVPESANVEILFGRHRANVPSLQALPFATQRPVTGDFVIFPGFYPHSTTPHNSPEARINMGFDVAPL